jgi:hypothetical protein
MNAIRQIFLLLRNTLLVMLAVAVGFTIGSAIGIPSWLQMVCLIPAAYLFIRLSGDPVPPIRRWVPYAVAITSFVMVMSVTIGLIRTHFPSLLGSSWPSLLIFSAIFLPMVPMGSFAAWIERYWPFGGADTTSESKPPCDASRTPSHDPGR